MDETLDPRILSLLGVEVWRKAPDLPYEVSNLGRVRNPRTGAVLKTGRTAHGYVTVGARLVHRLVLGAFEGPQPASVRCLHDDDRRDNNILANLSWGTQRENVQDMVRRGRLRSRNGAVVPTHPEVLRGIVDAVIAGSLSREKALALAGRSRAWLSDQIRERKHPRNEKRDTSISYEEALRLAQQGEEVWVRAVGPGSLHVSNFGRVRNDVTEKILKPIWSRKNGYVRVYGAPVHTMVMLSFSEKPFADAIVLHHGENDRKNNSLTNLRWGTYRENGADMVRHGSSLRGERHPRTRLTDERVQEGLRLYAQGGMTQKQLSDYLGGIGQGNVAGLVKGRGWEHIPRPKELDMSVDRRRGSNHHLSSLTDEKVAEGLRLAVENNWGAPRLAEFLGTSLGVGTQILEGRTWKHIPRPAGLAEQVASRKSSLTDAKVAEGLRLAAENKWSGAKLAEFLGVSRPVGGEILAGRAWKHVPRPEGLTKRSVAPSLTDEQVYDGLVQAKANGWGPTALGAYLGVDKGIAHKILTGSGYKHVPRP